MDSEEYCSCEEVKHWHITRKSNPIHVICNKKIRYSFPDLIVKTDKKTLVRKSPNDFDSDEGHFVINLYYYQKTSIPEISQQLNISEERIKNFLNELPNNDMMKRRYRYSQVCKSAGESLILSNSFYKKDAMCDDENKYAINTPESILKRGWVCPEGY